MINEYIRTLKSKQLYRLFVFFIEAHFFDIKFKVDTAKSDLSINVEENSVNHNYMSTYTKSVRKALHLIQKSIDGSINFIDAGSGKGKVLIIAYQEGIKNIIGVELDHAIHNISKRNLGSLGIDKVVKLYNTDILNFDDYPKQGTNVMFMYNPFGWGNSKFVRMSNP